MAVIHSEPRSSTILAPKLTRDLSSDSNQELIVTTAWNGPFIFGLVYILWNGVPSSVTTKVDLLLAGSGGSVLLLAANTGTEVPIVFGLTEGIRGLLFAEGDQLRVTVPAGGSSRFAQVWIYSGRTGS